MRLRVVENAPRRVVIGAGRWLGRYIRAIGCRLREWGRRELSHWKIPQTRSIRVRCYQGGWVQYR